MDTTNSVTLLVILSDNCQHCHIFKAKHLNTLTSLADKNRLCTVNVVDTEGAGSKLDYIRPGLSKYVQWFPCFILIPTYSWISSKTDIKNCSILGADNNNGIVTWNGMYNRDPNKIIEWIRQEISSNPFLTSKKIVTITSNSDTDLHIVPNTIPSPNVARSVGIHAGRRNNRSIGVHRRGVQSYSTKGSSDSHAISNARITDRSNSAISSSRTVDGTSDFVPGSRATSSIRSIASDGMAIKPVLMAKYTISVD